MDSTLLPDAEGLLSARSGGSSEYARPLPAEDVAKLEENIASAESRRQAGNTKFRADDIKGASADYERTLKLLSPDAFVGAEEDLLARAKACRVPAQLNLALCYLKAEPPEGFRALELCESVLAEEPQSAKATFRKAKALVAMEEHLEAEYEFVRAVKLAPGDLQIRKELEALRAHIRKDKEQEKRTAQAIMTRGPGFASDDRGAPTVERTRTSDNTDYAFFSGPKDNPYATVSQPDEEARNLIGDGRLKEAIAAFEAAIQQAADAGDWSSHFAAWLELGRLFMDLNIDALALRCLNKACGFDTQLEARGARPSHATLSNGLLLRSVCLLNEAESDTLAEVCDCLHMWLDAVGAGPAPFSDGGSDLLDVRMNAWRHDERAVMADVSVGQGLLHLLHGREESLQSFADALVAPADGESCFGPSTRLSVRWNMLGAVFANRSLHQQALTAYGEALKLQPYYPRALTNQGIAQQACGDSKSAAAAYAAALEVVPEWATEMLWELTRKAAQNLTEAGLAEAVDPKNQNLAGLNKALGVDALASYRSGPDQSVKEMLASVGLTGITSD